MFLRSFLVIGLAVCFIVYKKYNQADLYIAAWIGAFFFAAWAAIQDSYKNLILYTVGERRPGRILGSVTHGYRGHIGGPAVYFSYEYKVSSGMKIRKKFLILKMYLSKAVPFADGQEISVLIDPEKHSRATVFIKEIEALYNLEK